MTATRGFIRTAATTPLDTRKADAEKLVSNLDGSPRLGIIGNSPSIVTSDASTAPMRVAVAAAGFATQRVAGDGAAIWTNDGSIFLTVTKPGSQSWYVTVYAKHDDTDAGDGDSLPVLGVVTGAAAASPVEAALPAGATKLASVLIPSTATSTQSAGVVITNTYQMTAYAGGVVPFRLLTELKAWTTAQDGQLAYANDAGSLWEYIASATTPDWYHVGGKPQIGAFTPSGIYTAGTPTPQAVYEAGKVSLEGKVGSSSASFVAGTSYAIGSIPAAFAPPANIEYAVGSNLTALGYITVTTTGAITLYLNTSFTGTLNLTIAGASWKVKGLV